MKITFGILVLFVISIFTANTIVNADVFIFNKDLKIGSSGIDVVNLQTRLINNGYHIPSVETGSISKGYFGIQTKSAVINYQKAMKISTTGFVGPITRSSLNTNLVVSTVNPTITINNAISASSNNSAGLPQGITTPGRNGIMSVTSGPLSSTVMNVGAKQVPIISSRVQAQNSDLSVWGVTVDLGTDTAIYNKILSNIYIYDGAKLVYSSPLNSSTVVQVQGQYVVGTAGFNIIVPKGTYKDIVVKADFYSSIDSSYIAIPRYISIDQGSISAIDGAGIQLSGPVTNGLIVQAITINKSLVDNAQANISVDGTSPTTNMVPVSDTINGNYLGLPVFTFDVYAQNDTIHLHNVAVNLTATQNNTTGVVTAAYLFQGSTQVQSASVVNGVATFSNISDGTNGATIPAGTTVPYTVKVDVTGVTAGNLAITASVNTANTTIYNSIDGNVNTVGSALGNVISVSGNGASYALTSTPTIGASGSNNGTSAGTSTIMAYFPISIGSIGVDSFFGTTASSSPAFWFNVSDYTGNTIYTGNGIISTLNSANLVNVKVSLPTLPTSVTNGVTQANSYKVSNQNTVNLGTVQFQFDGRSANGQVLSAGPYKVNMKQIVSNSTSGYATTTFMNGLAAWTTSTGQNAI